MTPPAPSRRADPPAATVNGVLAYGLAQAYQYAASRPGCQVLASVRYGPVALCALCDQRRSTLGKGTQPVQLPDPRGLPEIAAASVACRQATSDLRRAVAAARQAGHPRSAVAAIPGGSLQAAQQRFAPTPDAASGTARKRTGR
jgi:hypothetical protein